MQCKTGACGCKMFAFVPGRPEDVGEFWFQRRRDFDPSTWRAKCRCKHTHEEHDPNGLRRCKFRGCSCAHFRIFIDDSLKLLFTDAGCGCGSFNSSFVCAACDKHYGEHETFFETEDERRRNGLPVGKKRIKVLWPICTDM